MVAGRALLGQPSGLTSEPTGLAQASLWPLWPQGRAWCRCHFLVLMGSSAVPHRATLRSNTLWYPLLEAQQECTSLAPGGMPHLGPGHNQMSGTLEAHYPPRQKSEPTWPLTPSRASSKQPSQYLRARASSVRSTVSGT